MLITLLGPEAESLDRQPVLLVGCLSIATAGTQALGGRGISCVHSVLCSMSSVCLPQTQCGDGGDGFHVCH